MAIVKTEIIPFQCAHLVVFFRFRNPIILIDFQVSMNRLRFRHLKEEEKERERETEREKEREREREREREKERERTRESVREIRILQHYIS